MRRYYTGLLPYSNESLPRPLKGRGWSVTTEPKLKDKSRATMASCNDEIVIYAKDIERARAGFSLILDAWAVLNGVLPDRDELLLVPHDKAELRELQTVDSINSLKMLGCWSTSGFLLSCLIAQRASLLNKFVYGIALCRQSIALHSNHHVDLDPALFPYQQRSLCPRDQIRFAYAIVSSYAVLEQIGLALHGECFKDGKWIEAKRQDLEARLSKAGLNISKPVSWYLRGGKTKLEIKRPPTVIKKSAWSRGAVRDCEVNLVDAVADLRWLRSRVAAHDLDSLVSGLSVHDVANAQELARGALLSSMGFNTKKIQKLYHQFELP